MIKEVWIDREVLNTPLARRIMDHFPGDKVRVTDDPGARGIRDEEGGSPGPAFKTRLLVTREKGRFLRPCPGSLGMQCCNLFVLNHGIGCPYDCAYCFLQSYQNEPFITLYANLEDLEREVRELIRLNRGKGLRICTGEVADSLALEPQTGTAVHLIELFARQDGALLELKTKSNRIEYLLDLDHCRKTVISWTLNTKAVAADLEQGAPSPRARLDAASEAVAAGYPVAFHFDPLIRYDGWREAYPALVEDLFDKVPPEAVQWISLGGFRYSPPMKALIAERFPSTRIFLEEFLPGGDGKYRYFSKHRIEMYRTLLQSIRERGSRVPVYLCMETDHVWRRVFGRMPDEIDLLQDIYGARKTPRGGSGP